MIKLPLAVRSFLSSSKNIDKEEGSTIINESLGLSSIINGNIKDLIFSQVDVGTTGNGKFVFGDTLVQFGVVAESADFDLTFPVPFSEPPLICMINASGNDGTEVRAMVDSRIANIITADRAKILVYGNTGAEFFHWIAIGKNS